MTEKSKNYELGTELIKKMLGDASLERLDKRAELFPDWDVFTRETLFGNVWQRPGLDLKMRSLCCVAAMTALGKEAELGIHMRGAFNNGATKEEVLEVIIQMGFYAGWPAAVGGIRVATEVFKEFGFLPAE